jgi:NTP pyrophosphatase (non-canonical NTP hydrolase)
MFQKILSQILAFRDARDWGQFHNAKDLALALSIESAELNECFLWKSSTDYDREKLSEELADVLIYALLLADRTGLDPETIIQNKLAKNEAKYPVDKAKGNARKYTEL